MIKIQYFDQIDHIRLSIFSPILYNNIVSSLFKIIFILWNFVDTIRHFKSYLFVGQHAAGMRGEGVHTIAGFVVETRISRIPIAHLTMTQSHLSETSNSAASSAKKIVNCHRIVSLFFFYYFSRHAARGIQSRPTKLPEFIFDKRKRAEARKGGRGGGKKESGPRL